MTALHRIKEVRLRDGVTVRTLARHLETTLPGAREIEDPEHDLRLTQLLAVAKLLNCPAGELLLDHDTAEVVRLRSLVLRLARITNTLLQQAPNAAIRSLAESQRNQILEAMPQAEGTGILLAVGRRRGGDEMGRVAEHQINFRQYVTEDAGGRWED